MYHFPLLRLGWFFLLVGVTALSCGGKPQVRVLPSYHSASLHRILILPVTGVSDIESQFMTSIISQAFEAQGRYEIVVYQDGQSEKFDQIMLLSRQVNGAIPLDMIPVLGRQSRADAVVVTHQSTIDPVEGITYRFESRTGAIIRGRTTPRHPRPSETGETSGFTPVDVVFPSGLTRMKMLDAWSIQRLWESQKEIESPSALKQMIDSIPPQRARE